jgi:hypothetical protein
MTAVASSARSVNDLHYESLRHPHLFPSSTCRCDVRVRMVRYMWRHVFSLLDPLSYRENRCNSTSKSKKTFKCWVERLVSVCLLPESQFNDTVPEYCAVVWPREPKVCAVIEREGRRALHWSPFFKIKTRCVHVCLFEHETWRWLLCECDF